jgi:predicted Fe-Mo cluster-binding NifX family protein
MRIAVSSQNFRTVTGHAGKSRRFLIYDATLPTDPVLVGRLDLPKEMAFHGFAGGPHPLDGMDVILTGSAGEGFVRKLASRGVKVLVTGETDPRHAVLGFLQGRVRPVPVQERGGGSHACGHGH